MAEYVELIGKYIVTRDESGTPSYSWTDNTGEIVRCKDCINWDTTWTNDFSPDYHYCPIIDGVRKDDFFALMQKGEPNERVQALVRYLPNSHIYSEALREDTDMAGLPVHMRARRVDETVSTTGRDLWRR